MSNVNHYYVGVLENCSGETEREMNWKHIDDIEPKDGEQYACLNGFGELVILAFLDTGRGMYRWHRDGKLGLEVEAAPVVAALIDTTEALAIFQGEAQNAN